MNASGELEKEEVPGPVWTFCQWLMWYSNAHNLHCRIPESRWKEIENKADSLGVIVTREGTVRLKYLQ